MRFIAIILAITLFSGSVKGSPIIQVIKTAVGVTSCGHGSSDETTSCNHTSDDESDMCCGDMGCECTCCVHVLIGNPLIDFDFIYESFADSKHFFSWDYQRDYLSTIFHPPALG